MQPSYSESRNQGEEVSEWVTAPDESHVAGFQFIDRSLSEFGASSELIVQFKGGKGRPPSMYSYKTTKHNALRSVFESMRGSDHPGEVVDAELKKKNVPYKRLK